MDIFTAVRTSNILLTCSKTLTERRGQLFRIWEALGSNLGPEIGYPD
jgi:hypothetical protein